MLEPANGGFDGCAWVGFALLVGPITLAALSTLNVVPSEIQSAPLVLFDDIGGAACLQWTGLTNINSKVDPVILGATSVLYRDRLPLWASDLCRLSVASELDLKVG